MGVCLVACVRAYYYIGLCAFQGIKRMNLYLGLCGFKG